MDNCRSIVELQYGEHLEIVLREAPGRGEWKVIDQPTGLALVDSRILPPLTDGCSSRHLFRFVAIDPPTDPQPIMFRNSHDTAVFYVVLQNTEDVRDYAREYCSRLLSS